EAYDQVIVGYLLQIAQELKSAGGAEAVALRRRISRLIRSLRPETLRRLVEMGGDFAQRRQFVADAAAGMAADAVLEILKAGAGGAGREPGRAGAGGGDGTRSGDGRAARGGGRGAHRRGGPAGRSAGGIAAGAGRARCRSRRVGARRHLRRGASPRQGGSAGL